MISKIDLTHQFGVLLSTVHVHFSCSSTVDLIHQFGVLLSTTHMHFSCSSTTASLSVLTEKNSGPEILKTSLGQHLSNLVMVYRQYVCQFWMFAELQLHKY